MVKPDPKIAEGSHAARILGWITAVVFAVALVTGMWLIFFYRPTAAQAWDDIYELESGIQAGLVIRSLHNLSSWLVVMAGLGWFVALAIRHRPRKAAYAIPWIALGAAAFITGAALAWDQLALWAVTVGTDMNGFEPVFSDKVRFVLVNGREVSTGEIRFTLLVHVLCGVGLSIGTWLTVRAVRTRVS